MPARMLLAVFALLVWAAPALARAQDATSTGGDLCARPEPARAMKLALDNDDVMVVIAQATGSRDLELRTPVEIVQVIEGTFDATTALADRQPTLACLSEGVWAVGRPVLGVFVADGTALTTLVAWPSEDGAAIVDGQRLTADELLALGRAFLEPTPTALPPGVPTPPNVEPPDSGAPQRLPATGGDAASDSRSPAMAGGVGLALASLAAGEVFLLRRRGM